MKNNIEKIYNDIDKYAINKPVRLIAASKFQSIDKMKNALKYGIKFFGENRGQEVRDKRDFFINNNVQLSFIGRLQKNKVKYLIGVCDMIQSIDSLEIARYVDDKYVNNNKIIDILIEVNISGEKNKAGFEIENVKENIKQIKQMKNLNIRGLMTLGPLTEDDEKIKNAFQIMYQLFSELKNEYTNFDYLSMGMTDDYKIALKNGSNMIRIGRLIFGERSK